MTAIAALLRTDTRPALLVSSERIVIDFNRALGRAVGSVEKGSDLAQYCIDRTDAIDAYLRRCAATRDP